MERIPTLPENPVDSANPLSRLIFRSGLRQIGALIVIRAAIWRKPDTFKKAYHNLDFMLSLWIDPIFKNGYNKTLEIEDLYRVPDEDRAEKLCAALEKEWENELSSATKPSLIWALVRWIRWRILIGGVILFIEDCAIKLAQPTFLAFLIRFLGSDDPAEQMISYYMAFGIVFSGIIFAFILHNYLFLAQHLAMKIRVASSSLVYRKVLRLSNLSVGKTSAGHIVNLISNDVNRLDLALNFFNDIYIGPIVLVIVTLILWCYIGVSGLAGISLFIIYVPLQLSLAKRLTHFRTRVSGRTDERIKIMTELLGAIRVVKMYAWEKSFRQLVGAVRRSEMKVVKNLAYTNAFNGLMYFTSNKITLLVIFGTMVITGQTLTSEKVFITLILIDLVRRSMTSFFPKAVSLSADMLVIFRRLEQFLLLEDLKFTAADQFSNLKTIPEGIGIYLENISGSWDEASIFSTLKEITFTCKPGTLTAIIGPVASGKSSLLMALLGEFPLDHGSMQIKGKLAYVSQDPWIFAGTIRNNILFGQSFDEQLYDKVIEVCALKQDLELLPFGDLSYVSDKGGSLSGGQKARVALARAVYFNADLYILDDPLSAVDTCVGHHIFAKCIKEFLKSKVCILATHQVRFLEEADQIIALECGRCVRQGTLNDLISAGIEVAELFTEHETESEAAFSVPIEISEIGDVDDGKKNFKMTKKPNVAEDESRKSELKAETTGAVRTSTYIRYFLIGASRFSLLALLFVSVLTQALNNGSDFWLKIWTDAEDFKIGLSSSYLTIYVSIVTAMLVADITRVFACFAMCVASSIRLHDRMLSSVVRSPMSFFYANPIGRILNRFSRDMGVIDDQLPNTAYECSRAVIFIIGTVIVLAIVSPWILFAASLLLVPLYYLRKIFMKTIRDLRRLEGTTRSPIYSHMTASLQGLSTIRTFAVQEAFTRQFDQLLDVHSAAWFLCMSSTKWLGLRVEFINLSFLTAVVVVVIVFIKNMTGGDVGLTISSVLALSEVFHYAFRQSTEMENQLLSVERVIEYCDLPSEAPLESKPDVQNSLVGWPQRGEIKMAHLSLSYSDDGPKVLNDINFTISAKEKIGIVGRTGAGKSSMISALIRLKETEGEILIDGVSIKDIGLNDLRKRISVIPQDPFLFSGTLRQNLDRFLEHSDDELWQVLDDVQLKSAISAFENGLEATISEGGSNLSCGQRQLICVARAILSKNRILILDEATANVDLTTDALIQKTIKTNFNDCTVLTIAHRLQTVIDSDRILVLDAGCIVEFDEPYLLLRNKNGFLRSMVENGPDGSTESKSLRKIAKQKYRDGCRTMNSMANENDDLHVNTLNDVEVIMQMTKL